MIFIGKKDSKKETLQFHVKVPCKMQGKIKNDEIYSLIYPRHASSPFSVARGL